MEHKLPIGWRFFKVMMPGFHTKLRLPPIVCKKLNEEKPKEVVLISYNGRWKVKIQECKDRLCFRQGWDDFVRQHGLALGDFMVFEHTGSLYFRVILFDRTCCEKGFDVKPETSNERGRTRGKNSCTGQGNSCFTTTIKSYHVRKAAPFMYIPQKFCTSNGLLESTSFVLRGPCGKTWPAKLKLYGKKWKAMDYGCIVGGWKKFAKYYKLKEKDVCSFQLIGHPTSYSFMLDVKVCPDN